MSRKLGKCPLCDGSIIEKEKTFACDNSNWSFDEHFEEWSNTGCNFSIHKESLRRYGKRKIKTKEIVDLFKNGFFVAKLRNRYKQDYFKYIYISNEFGVSVDFDTEVETAQI
jgi:uncharacterized protein YutD